MSDVTIYTRKFCGYCSAAMALLDKKGVEYDEHDGTFDREIRAEMIKKANGASTFPQIFVGALHVGGCDELMDLERQGGLDPLLAKLKRKN